MRNREHAHESEPIVSTPPAGLLERANCNADFETMRPKIVRVASHCKSATCRCVTWKDLQRVWLLRMQSATVGEFVAAAGS